MRYRAEHAAQAVAQLLERHHQRGERGIVLRGQFREARAILDQHLFKGGTRMARLDTPEVRQCAEFQKWIVHRSILADARRDPAPGDMTGEHVSLALAKPPRG